MSSNAATWIPIEDDDERDLGWSKTQPLVPLEDDEDMHASSSSSTSSGGAGGIHFHTGHDFDVDHPLSHSHSHSHDHDHDTVLNTSKQREKRKLMIACGLCTVFFLMELLGGIYTDSLALFSDSFHMLTDLVSFLISLSAIYIGTWPASGRYNFGYHRAEVVGAFLSILLIYVMTGALLVEAVHRLQEPERIKGVEMFIIAFAGVLMNIFMALTLHDFGHHPGHDHSHAHSGHSHSHNSHSGHSHSHNSHSGHSNNSHSRHSHHSGHSREHSHDEEVACQSNDCETRSIDRLLRNNNNKKHSHSSHSSNINIRAAIIHLIGDLVASIGVLIAAGIIMADQLMYPDKQHEFRPVQLADPICTFIFSVFVVGTTIPLVRECLTILMERAPAQLDRTELKRAVLKVPGVERVLSAQCWLITMNMPAIMLTVRGRSTPHLHSPSTGTLVTGGASEAAEGAVQLVQHDSDCRFANTISGQHVTFAVPEDTETTNNVNNQLSPLDSVASSSGMTVPCCSKSAISLQLMSRSGGGGVPCGARIIDIRDHDLLITRIQRAMWERYRVRREFCSVMVRYDNGDDDGLIVQ